MNSFLLLLFPALFVLELGYYFIARRTGIGAEVCERSSHTRFTPTGGGIIFALAVLIWGVFAQIHGTLPPAWWWMLGGTAVLASVSLADDIHPMPPTPRLLLQIVVVALVYKQFCYPEAIDIYILLLFCGVGCINAFNFIDGIAGMLTLMSLVVVGTLIYALHEANFDGDEVYIALCCVLFVSLLVFACFNLPDKIFAGDAGAMTLGFVVGYILLNLILHTRDASYSILILVLVFDTGMTTLQRLFAGHNILLPHRQSIYEVLTSSWKLPPLTVSIIYALLQLLISVLYFSLPESQRWTYFIMVLALLIVSYFEIRRSPRSNE